MLALQFSRAFTAHQWARNAAAVIYYRDESMPAGQRGRSLTLPDVTVWSRPGEHHEIKHKEPTGNAMFGLEQYRFEALVWFSKQTGQNVFYTIHNHALNNGRDNPHNNANHWLTANVLTLESAHHETADGPSWVNGARRIVPIIYWSVDNWVRLIDLWRLLPAIAA